MSAERRALKQKIFQYFGSLADIGQAHQFWFDARPTAGLRLTPQAFDILTTNKFDHHEFAMPKDAVRRPSCLLRLDRYLQFPYFVAVTGHPGLVLFSERDALMANLYGDIEKFINSLGG